MPIQVLKDCFLSIDGTEFSDHVRSVTLDSAYDLLEKTAMTNETRTRTKGLFDWTLSVEFYQDYNGSVEAALWNASTQALVIRPTTAASSTSNPQFSGTGILENNPMIAGAVGELPMASVRWLAAGDLTRTA